MCCGCNTVAQGLHAWFGTAEFQEELEAIIAPRLLRRPPMILRKRSVLQKNKICCLPVQGGLVVGRKRLRRAFWGLTTGVFAFGHSFSIADISHL